MSEAKPYMQEGYELMGAAFEVHNEQGGGLAEEIYQQSLEVELELRGIAFDSKRELKVFYKGRELEKKYVPDLFVFEGIIAELKSVWELLPEHKAQLMNYMRLTSTEVGYLINFGPIGKLEYKRIIITEF